MENPRDDNAISIAHRVLQAGILFLKEIGVPESEVFAALQRCSTQSAPLDSPPLSDMTEAIAQISRLLWQWRTSPAFTSDAGVPLPLPRTGVTSLEFLSQKCNISNIGDLVALALSMGCLEERDGLLWPSGREVKIPETGPIQLWYDANVACRALESLAFNAHSRKSGRETQFQRFAHQNRLDKSHLPLFRRFVREQGESFLESIDDWMERHKVDDNASDTTEVSIHTFVWTSDFYSNDADDATTKTQLIPKAESD